jgi:hypothetical protein
MDLTNRTAAGLWLAVVLVGLFHGTNPGMGWPLAVSAGLMGRGLRDLVSAMGQLAVGHFAAILLVLLPFTLMLTLIEYQRELRIGASLLVIGFGIYRLLGRRHPRRLARIRPDQLVLWSFAIALAHGAGLMILPIYLGLCRTDDLDAGHRAAAALMTGDVLTALAVSLVHTLAMIGAGGVFAVAVYAWLGLRFLAKSWFNLDALWAASLVLVGAFGLLAGGQASAVP